jgi:hypothetical protein
MEYSDYSRSTCDVTRLGFVLCCCGKPGGLPGWRSFEKTEQEMSEKEEAVRAMAELESYRNREEKPLIVLNGNESKRRMIRTGFEAHQSLRPHSRD